METIFVIEGSLDSSGINKLSDLLKKTNGVNEFSIDRESNILLINFNGDVITDRKIVSTINKLGYRVV